MRSLLYIGGGLLIGVGLAYGDATVRAEASARTKYQMQLDSHLRAMERVRTVETHAPVQAEEDLADTSTDAITVGGEMIVESPIATPDYIAEATRYAEQPVELMSLEYIEDEEYHEEDGRSKEQIMIVMSSEGDAMFIQDGEVIDNWAEKIGSEILVDFYVKCPPGESRVLYVRNHRLDEDFEVLQEMP